LAQGGLRTIIRRLLARYDYPPDAEAKAIELVIRQMETFAEDCTPNAAQSKQSSRAGHVAVSEECQPR
jgi:Domain of unknown function (DUF3387)